MHWTDEIRATIVSGAISALERANDLSNRMARLQMALRWRRFGLSYAGAPDDIFIVAYPKSGTTLMQMLVYQLLTDGGIAFDHISSFCPYLERDLLPRQASTLDAIATLPRPHVVKSHLPYALMPKGPGRYIYVMRNGLDVAVSFYKQQLRAEGPAPAFPAFFDAMLEGNLPASTWFEHVAGWSGNRERLNVLYVTYEDLLADIDTQARRVADFCGVTIPDSEWPRVCANCSFDFMRLHERKLDDWFGDARQDLHFIRKGIVGGWRDVVTPPMLRRFRSKYDATLGSFALPNCLRGEGESSVV